MLKNSTLEYTPTWVQLQVQLLLSNKVVGVTFSFHLAPWTSPRRSSLEPQRLLHTPSSLSYPRPRLPSPPLALILITSSSAPTPSLLAPFPILPPTLLNTETPRPMDLPWISPGSPLHLTDTRLRVLSLLPFSCFSCFTFTSAPLLLRHLTSPYLASIFDPLYHH